MLLSLSIKNFILIDEIGIEFKNGLTIITGETGSGKSMLLDALSFALGLKIGRDAVKSGKEFCSATAVFSLNEESKKSLEDLGLSGEDGLLVLRVVQSSSGVKKIFANDNPITSKALRDISSSLSELYRQNSHIELLGPSSHMKILDDYGECSGVRKEVSESFSRLRDLEKEIENINKEREKTEREIDYLDHCVGELESLDVKEGEEDYLSRIRLDAQNNAKNASPFKEIAGILSSPEIENSLNKALRIISRNPDSRDLIEIGEKLNESYSSWESAKNSVREFLSSAEDSGVDLEAVGERLFDIREKSKKYGIGSENFSAFSEECRIKSSSLKNMLKGAEGLEGDLRAEKENYLNLSGKLTEKRISAAEKLTSALQRELAFLHMEKAIFKVCLDKKGTEFSPSGAEDVIFRASTNPGTSLKPINEIASGGEISRLALALRSALLDKAGKALVVFDEIDSGVSGKVADAVGDRLKKISLFTQVLAITHQTQVAAKADTHISVAKKQSENSTEIFVNILTGDERKKEIASMISGKSLGKNAVKTAEEILGLAEE